MKRAFSLVELLVVLGIIALGWLWVPSLFQSFSGSSASHFTTHLPLMNARARMEALTRQRPVAFAINAAKTQMAVICQGDEEPLVSAPIPPEAVFNEQASSVNGSPGVFFPVSTGSDLWRAWWYTAQGQPLQQGGTLVFGLPGRTLSYQIADEGALIEL